jgi:ApaG protein
MKSSESYEAITHGISVAVRPVYLAERSDPRNGHYFWAYTVTIANRGERAVTLRTRHWRITDGHGRLQRVDGPGVVGEQPRIEPGDQFEYTSGCPLGTPSGFMAGHYTMETDAGESLDVQIPNFSLDRPGEGRTVN